MTLEMWLGLVVIGAGVQGFLLTFYLFTSSKANVEANSILALIVFSVSVDIFTAFLPGLKGSIQANPTILLYGPLVYLYVVSLCGPHSPAMRKFTYAAISLYAIPIVLYLLNVIRHFSAFTGPGFFPFQMKHEFLGVDIFQLTPFSMMVLAASTAVFLFLSARELRQYYRRVQNYSSNGSILITARSQFVLYLSAFSLLALLVLYLMTGSRVLAIEPAYQILRWCMALSIYALGYIALKKPELLFPAYSVNMADNASSQLSEIPDLNESSESLKTVRDSVLKQRLLNLMDSQQPYLDTDLSLPLLADKLQVHPKTLSNVINSELGCNFFDFVNRYRVAEVKKRLADTSTISKTIMVIAYECGFNTKSSFNAIFRKFEKVTPTEFRKAALQRDIKATEQNSARVAGISNNEKA